MAYYEVGPFFPLLMMNLGIFMVAQEQRDELYSTALLV